MSHSVTDQADDRQSNNQIFLARMSPSTHKQLLAIERKTNAKEFGRKIRRDEIIGYGLSLIKAEDIKKLQEATLSNSDRLEMAYRQHVHANGPVSKDAFLGHLLQRELGASPIDLDQKALQRLR